MSKWNFPPVGRNAKYQILVNGEVFAGFDDEIEANKALKMYRDQPRSKATQDRYRWEIRIKTGPSSSL